MKKIALIAVTVFASLNMFAQGTVTFANSSSTLVMNSQTSAPLASGGSFLVALYWGATGSAEGDLVQIGSTTTIFTAGRYSGGTRTTGNATAPGGTAVFQVRAWDGAYGATWDAFAANSSAVANSALWGKSTLFTSATGGAGSPPSTAVSLASTAPGFTLTPVPEPSTYALGAMALGSLFFIRRRK